MESGSVDSVAEMCARLRLTISMQAHEDHPLRCINHLPIGLAHALRMSPAPITSCSICRVVDRLSRVAAEAVRVLARKGKRGEVIREVTAFRRPDRTYLFFVTYAADDRSARDAAHRCVESVEWK